MMLFSDYSVHQGREGQEDDREQRGNHPSPHLHPITASLVITCNCLALHVTLRNSKEWWREGGGCGRLCVCMHACVCVWQNGFSQNILHFRYGKWPTPIPGGHRVLSVWKAYRPYVSKPSFHIRPYRTHHVKSYASFALHTNTPTHTVDSMCFNMLANTGYTDLLILILIPE